MAKPLPKEDFRAARIVLEPSDFAAGSELPDPPPKDLISEDMWNHLVGLPDDVAIRTTNDFGSILKELSEFQTELLSVLTALQGLATQTGGKNAASPIHHVLLVAHEDFQASIFDALIGYYRVAFSSLRNVVENFTIGLHFELSRDQTGFRTWLAGNYAPNKFLFGWAADSVAQNQAVQNLEQHLTNATADNFFRQRAGADTGGFARRLFGNLSRYSHGRPGFTHGDIWESNGPVFVPKAFTKWAIAFAQVYCFCLIVCRLAQPKLNRLDCLSKSGLTVKALFDKASDGLRPEDDGKNLFQNLPPDFW